MLKTELQAHSRMLSAMAVHPTRPLFATAAEDATMAVWQMPDDDQEVCWLLSSSLVAAFVSSQQQATNFQLRIAATLRCASCRSAGQ